MPALIVSAILVKALVIGVTVHLLAVGTSLFGQLVIVFVSSITTGSFVLAAAIITARSHARMTTSLDDVKRKVGADQRAGDPQP